MRGLLVATRPLYLPGGLVLYALGVLLGRSARWSVEVLLGAAVVVFVHVLTHFVNDAEDVATDERTVSPTFLSGGSRAVQRGLVTPALLRRGAIVLAVLVVGLGVVAVAMGDGAAAALFAAMLLLGYSYSGPPLRLGTRGLGEVTAAAVMGVLVPLTGAHAARGATPALWAVLPLLFVATVFARLCTAFPDIDADRETHKWTVPALLGPRRSAIAFFAAAVAAGLAGLVGPTVAGADGQRASAAIMALTAGVVAALVAAGVLRKKVVVPMVGLAAYALVLAILVWTAVAR